MPEIFEELDRQADKWEPTAAALTKGGSRFLRSSVHKPDYYPKHRSPRVNAMRKRQVDVVLNQQKKEATKKLAKKGVRPS